MLAGCILTSCEDDINVGKEKEDGYIVNSVGVFAVDQNGKKDMGVFEFREQGVSKLTLKLNKAISEKLDATLKYDPSVLERYNKENENDYEIFPADLISISDEGKTEIEAGNKTSKEVILDIKSNGNLDGNKSYVIPISIITNNKEVELKEANYLIFVKDMTGIPSAEKLAVGDDGKSRRVEIVSCMEMGDTNPLNNLSFTLKNSGKPLVDVLVMFSGNVKYNEEEGKVYISINSPIQHVLDNSETYLKPLKDRGIKVVMGIMPHWDRVSLMNLDKETANAFVKDLQIFLEAYDLDGVFWDEEYAAPINPPPLGFVKPNKESLAYMLHEYNRVMPDKLSMVYDYGIHGLPTVGDKKGGEYITHVLLDYGGGSPIESYPGLPDSGYSPYSVQFANGNTYYGSELSEMRNKGYCSMIFAMDPYRPSYQSQKYAMEQLARYVFEDELVIGDFYKKDY